MEHTWRKRESGEHCCWWSSVHTGTRPTCDHQYTQKPTTKSLKSVCIGAGVSETTLQPELLIQTLVSVAVPHQKLGTRSNPFCSEWHRWVDHCTSTSCEGQKMSLTMSKFNDLRHYLLRAGPTCMLSDWTLGLSHPQMVSVSTPPTAVTDKHTARPQSEDRWTGEGTLWLRAWQLMKEPGVDREISRYLGMIDKMAEKTWSHANGLSRGGGG